MDFEERIKALRRFAPFLLVPIVIGALFALDFPHDVIWPVLAGHELWLRTIIAAQPIAAAATYVLLYALATAVALPEGAILTIFGGFLFGTALGGILTVLGATTGAVTLFLATRAALAGPLTRRAGPRLQRIRAGLERDGFSYLLSMRLIPLLPFWLVNIAPALVGMRLAPFALATFIGIIPGTFIFASVGAGLGAVLQPGQPPDLSMLASPKVVLPLAALGLLSLLPVLWRRLRRANA